MASLKQANRIKKLLRESYHGVEWFKSVTVALGDDGYYLRLLLFRKLAPKYPKEPTGETFLGVRIEYVYE